MKRRSVLALIGTIGVAGCTASSSEGSDDHELGEWFETTRWAVRVDDVEWLEAETAIVDYSLHNLTSNDAAPWDIDMAVTRGSEIYEPQRLDGDPRPDRWYDGWTGQIDSGAVQKRWFGAVVDDREGARVGFDDENDGTYSVRWLTE